MPLDYGHQLGLLKDILLEHQSDCCGTVAECEQLERVIKSLLANTNVNENIKNILEPIHTYSQTGKNSPQLNDHIESHQNILTEWINDIDSYS
ncbi:YtzH-like family protein [Metabacillus fastidiosus]|uniref:YtzH-like family protein n=1 Tax=Metabacillus fastidiosus TaxID=1458 RepID=UPI002DB60E77|nr:YtzH-like family protein [Metabacillus fastidiosus]MEC2077411.1 YtzH-like family protein [Metabacillus fastidiosus]MED4533483.1 YtzH-like family protein [Metabacillus fastidiosus]